MRVADVKKLKPGDEVRWNDPDEGRCSRVLGILTIEVRGNVVSIMEKGGAVVECFARELK